MADISPSRDSQNVPVVVIVIDSTLTHSMKWDVVLDYRTHLLRHFAEGNPFSEPRVGFVTYGPPDRFGPPVLVTRFLAEDAHRKLEESPDKLGMCRIGTGDTRGIDALQGYAAAIKMFDELKNGPDQKPEEELSFHLWHFAAGQPDDGKEPHEQSTLDNLTWKSIPAELKKRNINCSMILARPSPKFEQLFSTIAKPLITPWFPIHPHHTILLSGFASSLGRGAAIPSTVPSKRPAESSAEQRSQRPNIANPPLPLQSVEMLRSSGPELPAREPQCASGADLTIAGESAGQTSGERLVMLEWWNSGTPSHAKVLAADQIGDLQVLTWPKILQLELTGPAVSITEFQQWIKKTKPATARFRPASGTDDHNFGLLVKLLRETRCYAAASWEIQGSDNSTTNLLFAPFAQDLLCAAFPATGIPHLPMRRLQQEVPTVLHIRTKPRVPPRKKQPPPKSQPKMRPCGRTSSDNSRDSFEHAYTGRPRLTMTLRPRRPCKQLSERLHTPTRSETHRIMVT